MDTSLHNMGALFAQLGLPNSSEDITNFISVHRDLGRDLLLHRASFWTVAQADFLKEAILADSDWAEVVDHLNASLHH